MRAIRSFTPRHLLPALLLVLGTSACDLFGVGYPDFPTELDDTPADDPDGDSDEDDLPGGPSSDDDDVASDPDPEPDGAPCFGREQTDENYDCDPIPDMQDIFDTDPNEPRVLWHDSIVADEDANWRQVGFGYGSATEDGWLYENGQAVLRIGNWIVVEVAPGYYRVNIRSENGDWGMFNDYCWDGVELENGDVVRDPACVYDNGCEADEIPEGWAMAFRATEDYTRRLTSSERDDLPLAEENCPSLNTQ